MADRERMLDALRIAKTHYFDLWDEATRDGSHVGGAKHYDVIWQGLDDALRVLERIPDVLAGVVIGTAGAIATAIRETKP